MDHLACMATFAAVVEKGGFAAAARHLSVAPASVTRHVVTLEHRVGARLLHRTTRKCSVTEAGRAFYERGVRILEDIREADAIASEFQSTSRGTVRVQTSPTLSAEIGVLIARYAAAHPETTFDLTAANQMGDLLGDGIDLALRDDPTPESSLIVRRIASVEWTPCASLDHVARHGVPVHPADLAEHNCLVYVRGGDWGEWRFTGGGGGQAVRVSGDLRSNDPQALRSAALASQGVVLLPDAMVSEDLRTERLVRVLSGYSAESATVRAIYPSRRHLPLKVRTFLDFVAGAFAGPRQIELTVVGPSTGRAALRDELPTGRRLSSAKDNRSPPSGPGGSIGGRDLGVARILKASGAGRHAAL